MCDDYGNDNRFEFGYILVGILQMYTMQNTWSTIDVRKRVRVYFFNILMS